MEANVKNKEQKHLFRKKLFFLFLLCIMLPCRLTAHAKELTGSSIQENHHEWEQRVFRDKIPDNQKISAPSSIDGEMEVITKGAGDASVQVNINIPDSYRLTNTIIIQISNDTANDVYELGLYYENSYAGRMNIPEGDYTVIAAMVVNDYSGYYAIPTGQKFTVKKGDSSTHGVTLDVQPRQFGESKGGPLPETTITPETPGQQRKQTSKKSDSFVIIIYFFFAALLLFSAITYFHQKKKKGMGRKTNIF